MSDARVEALLAQILLHQMHGSSQSVKAVALHRAGLSNAEIAGLIGTTAGVIAQQLYESRSAGRKRAKASSKAAKKAQPTRRRRSTGK
jgi:hypothetical protein